MNFKTICTAFSCTDIHTDEGYRKVLLRRRRFFISLLLLGIVTFSVAALAEFMEWNVTLSSHTLGFYSGVGAGLTFGAIVFLVRLHRTMKDEKALRKSRIAATDERTQEINRRSLAVAGYALLIALYLTCLIGGLFYPELLAVLGGLAFVFFGTYLISYFIYNKIM